MSGDYVYGNYAAQYGQPQPQAYGANTGAYGGGAPANGYGGYGAQNETYQQYGAQQAYTYEHQQQQAAPAQQQQYNQYSNGSEQRASQEAYHQHQYQQRPQAQAPSFGQPAMGTVEERPAEATTRWSWSLYSMNRIDGARMVAPLGCLYSPLGSPCTQLNYAPTQCTVCGGVLNPYATLDPRSRMWGCPLCHTKNALPPQHQQANQYNLPPEMQPSSTTVEFVAHMPSRSPPTFVLVVDTCLDTDEELQGLRDFLLQSLQMIPEYAKVAIVTYGTTVSVHEIAGPATYPRAMVLRGTQEMTVERLKLILPNPSRFVAALRNCAAYVTQLISSMSRDLWPVMKGHRPLRCTGAALSVAASLLQIVSPNTGSCILTFMSGVCTSGPGIVVDVSREKMIRVHADIRDETAAATYWSTSCAFYEKLMHRIVAQGHSLNCFVASLDQFGLAEMKTCVQSSGGVVLNAESWLEEPFRLSLHQFFARREDGTLKLGLNATMDVITSPTWKVQGVIGPCVGTGKMSASVAEYEIGLGGTCQWTTCQLDSTTTFAIYYDTASTQSNEAAKNPLRYTQIVTRYEMGQETHTRVTTLTLRQAQNPPIQDLVAAFDQETAAVLLAREAVHKTDSMPLFDVLRWLDRTVVRLVSRFGQYTKDKPDSLRLPKEFVYFPAFMYHLRRSGYLQIFNSSPDETASLRLQLLKSNVEDSIVQIQPTLYSYRMDAAPQPVPLDSTAIQPDNVLLLDTFFEVLIHYGASIAAWKKAGYAEHEDYAHFKKFLEVPLADAHVLVGSRYPTPRLIDVCQDDPDARILYNRINPSRSYASTDGGAYGSHEGELVYTDDASLQVFMQHLKKLAVAQ
ncbi:protein transport protein Sec23-like protein [Leishmania donovani]|uniref:Protein transport protein SEC23 n=1 Tax=Leishmania donovani TaxID=5661 RepID=A0A504XNZ6_LEIDO|nr:Sec23/Sec24 trunk domain family protein [Leishmania donovani]CAJ1994053.1 protein transport protein Sec23-like protein [Leishmania donovani]VDZ49872.1 protein_transport_protein_Sec23-like_protein/GeneDB:LmjF.36.6430 [Leishmania donovani]